MNGERKRRGDDYRLKDDMEGVGEKERGEEGGE